MLKVPGLVGLSLQALVSPFDPLATLPSAPLCAPLRHFFPSQLVGPEVVAGWVQLECKGGLDGRTPNDLDPNHSVLPASRLAAQNTAVLWWGFGGV